jgi:hypothetical protein
MSEYKLLRRIFGHKWKEVAGGLRKLHNEELHNLYALPNMIREIKSRKVRWAGHIARTRETRNAYKVWSENLKGRDLSEELGVDGRIILEEILGKEGGKVWTGCIWLRIGINGELLWAG